MNIKNGFRHHRDKLETLMENSEYMLPEFFYQLEIIDKTIDKLPKWSSSDFMFILIHRKILEQFTTRQLIPLWMKALFSGIFSNKSHSILTSSFSPSPRISRDLEPSKLKLNLTHIDCAAGVFPSLTLLSNGTIISLTVQSNPFEVVPLEATKTIPNHHLINHLIASENCFYAFGDGITEKRIIKIEQGIITNTVSLKRRMGDELITFLSNGFLFCPDLCSVSLYDFTYSKNPIRLCITTSPIIAICSNEEFKSFVIATADGYIRIYSLYSGEMSAEVKIDGYADKMIFTSKWGLIIVQTFQKLYVFNVNGLLINEIQFQEKVRTWHSLSFFDIDFIVIETINHKIAYFDPGSPDNIYQIGEIPNGVASIVFDQKFECFIVLSFDGTLNIVPNICFIFSY